MFCFVISSCFPNEMKFFNYSQLMYNFLRDQLSKLTNLMIYFEVIKVSYHLCGIQDRVFNCQKSVYLVKFHCLFKILFISDRLKIALCEESERESVFCLSFRKRLLKSPSYNGKSTEGITFKTFAIFDRRKRKSMHLKQDKRVTELEHFFVNYCRIVCLA